LAAWVERENINTEMNATISIIFPGLYRRRTEKGTEWEVESLRMWLLSHTSQNRIRGGDLLCHRLMISSFRIIWTRWLARVHRHNIVPSTCDVQREHAAPVTQIRDCLHLRPILSIYFMTRSLVSKPPSVTPVVPGKNYSQFATSCELKCFLPITKMIEKGSSTVTHCDILLEHERIILQRLELANKEYH